MRNVISALLCAMLAMDVAAQETSPQPPTERQLREECSFDASGVRECLQKKLLESETALEAAETAVNEAISRWDTDAKLAKLARQKLTEASTSFTKYRVAQCAFASALGGSAIGNALEMRRLSCVTELNLRRAETLKSFSAELAPR